MKDEARASLDYYNSKEYTPEKFEDDVVCCKCGKELKAKEAALRYIIHPLTNLFLPPELRKYWCNECLKS